MSEILVYLESGENGINDISLQCLAKAKEIAKALSVQVTALLIGSSVKALVPSAEKQGAEKVFIAEDVRLKDFLPTPYKQAAVLAIGNRPIKAVFLAATCQGNDLAPHLASALKAACVLDCQTVTVEGGKLVAKKSEFEGKVIAHFKSLDTKPVVMTFKDGLSELSDLSAGKKCETSAVSLNLNDKAFASKVLKREIAKSMVDLRKSKIIVTAGAGVGSKENFKLIEDLAKAIGGEIGATRPVVDSGWTTADRQIGQTGVTVKPDLYIACGVSGAVQHRVGMMDAKKIIAINTDAAAPIFKYAHYRIVGDIKDVLPKLVKLLS